MLSAAMSASTRWKRLRSAEVEARRRLVDDEQPRIAGEGQRDAEAAQHAARVGGDGAVRVGPQVHPLEELRDLAPPLGLVGPALEPREPLEELPSGDGRIGADVLRQVPQPPAHVVGVGERIDPVERDRPAVRLLPRWRGSA